MCNNFHGFLRWLLTTFDWIVLFTGNSDFGIFSLWLLIRGRWSHMEALLCYSHTTNCEILLYPLTKNLLVCFQDWKDSVANTTTNLKKINKKNPSSKIRHILHCLKIKQYHMHSLLLACDKPCNVLSYLKTISYHVRIGTMAKFNVIEWLLLVMRVTFLTSLNSFAFPSWKLNMRLEIEKKIIHIKEETLHQSLHLQNPFLFLVSGINFRAMSFTFGTIILQDGGWQILFHTCMA